jgi:hypothetical protein
MVQGSGSYEVIVTPVRDEGIGIVCSQFVDQTNPFAPALTEEAIDAAVTSLRRSGFTSVSTSLAMRRFATDGPVLLAKPLRFLNWTAEQAFHDASLIARSAVHAELSGTEWRAVPS